MDGKKITNIINLGFLKGSVSLSKFIGVPCLNGVTSIKESFDEDFIKKLKGENFYVLNTDLIGSVSCKSYLIISKDDAAKVCGSIRESVPSVNQLSDRDILQEMDNILVAGVVTEFCNKMKVNVYGGVPVVSECSSNNVCYSLKEGIHSLDFDVDDFDYYYNINSSIMFTSIGAKCAFVWFMPDEFAQSFK